MGLGYGPEPVGGLQCVVLFILGPDCSVGSGVNRVQVGFSVRLFCFVQAQTLCRHGSMYFWAALVLVCVDVMICVDYDLNWCSWWWYVCSVYVE